MATAKKKEIAAAVGTYINYLDILDDVAKVVKLNSISIAEESRMHTGLLSLDLILGRGVGPTWCTFFGPEQSAKTTLAITLMAATLNQKVPISVLWDAEQSSGSSADYIQNILEVQGVKGDVGEIFGTKKDGKWVIKPKVFYQDESNGEVFFNWLHALLKRLPDKRYENEKWWYVYDNTKANIAKYSSQANQKLTSANEGIWLPAEDDSLQAVVIVDSYPSLMPTAQDNDEHTKAMAVQARMFSLQLPRVKGFLRSKRVAVIGINQLRLNPGAMFGSPETEPGGQALRFNSDQRIRLYPRSSNIPFNPKLEGPIESEPSINGGIDRYRYINGRTIKNKLATPNREMWFRLWVSDDRGEGMGYDPVWDTFYSCFLCGMITGRKHSMLLDIPGLGEAKKNINWLQFKKLILGNKEQKAEICAILGYKNIDLRKGLIGLSKKGKMEDMYLASTQEERNAKNKKAGAGEAATVDKDEDEDAK